MTFIDVYRLTRAATSTSRDLQPQCDVRHPIEAEGAYRRSVRSKCGVLGKPLALSDRYTHPLAGLVFLIRVRSTLTNRGGRCGKEQHPELGAEDDAAGAWEETAFRRETLFPVNVEEGS